MIEFLAGLAVGAVIGAGVALAENARAWRIPAPPAAPPPPVFDIPGERGAFIELNEFGADPRDQAYLDLLDTLEPAAAEDLRRTVGHILAIWQRGRAP